LNFAAMYTFFNQLWFFFGFQFAVVASVPVAPFAIQSAVEPFVVDSIMVHSSFQLVVAVLCFSDLLQPKHRF